jgi:hypothetical protein
MNHDADQLCMHAEVAAVRAKFAGRYVGHDEAATPVTVLAPGWLVTYAHGAHENWLVGSEVPVSTLQQASSTVLEGYLSGWFVQMTDNMLHHTSVKVKHTTTCAV